MCLILHNIICYFKKTQFKFVKRLSRYRTFPTISYTVYNILYIFDIYDVCLYRYYLNYILLLGYSSIFKLNRLKTYCMRELLYTKRIVHKMCKVSVEPNSRVIVQAICSKNVADVLWQVCILYFSLHCLYSILYITISVNRLYIKINVIIFTFYDCRMVL